MDEIYLFTVGEQWTLFRVCEIPILNQPRNIIITVLNNDHNH